jgi:2-iminoacetate synthase ThiH
LLENQFKEVFGESKQENLNYFQSDIVNKVKSHAEMISLKTIKEEEFSIMDIEVAMNETNNSKAIG